MPVNDRFEVFELTECLKQICHLSIVDTTIIEAHPIDILLEILGSDIKSFAMASTQRVVCQI